MATSSRPSFQASTDFEHCIAFICRAVTPGMDTPWPMLTLALSLVLFCAHIGPRLMANQKVRDLKPFMLIIDGAAFGTYTCGVLLYLVTVNFGYDCFFCDRYYREENDDIRIVGSKYITYILVLTKIYDFNKPVMSVLAKQVRRRRKCLRVVFA